MDRLFFVYMPDCPTCKAIRPVVRQFRDRRRDVKVIPVDITETQWMAEKWMPEVTPTLIKLDRRGRTHVFDGRPAEDGPGRIIEPQEVERWLRASF